MEKLTKEEAIKRHRMMWSWIADETLRIERKVKKSEAMRHFNWETMDVELCCWCCTYDSQISKGEDAACLNCPIQWPGKEAQCNELYSCWTRSEDYKKAADLAYRIANLSEKK